MDAILCGSDLVADVKRCFLENSLESALVALGFGLTAIVSRKKRTFAAS
jgi:hypothetical protein